MTTTAIEADKIHPADEGFSALEKRRFTANEYLKMAELGVLAPNEKLELINGEIYKKMSPIGTPHLWCVNRINQLFVTKLSGRAFISPQNPILLDDYNEPEPDITVLPLIQSFERPTAKDALLIVEVSDSTVKADRKVKLPLYASFGIVEVWLVNLNANQVEVYREPKDNEFRQTFIFDESQFISPLKFPDAQFSVAEILGSKPLSFLTLEK